MTIERVGNAAVAAIMVAVLALFFVLPAARLAGQSATVICATLQGSK